MAQPAYRPIQTTISDFEQYTADAKKAMESVSPSDPLYLILEGVYRDRKSAEDQVRGALLQAHDATLDEAEEALVAMFSAGPPNDNVTADKWDAALEVTMDPVFQTLREVRGART